MEFKDYYKTLGVERTATADDIKSAYRKLARKYHPDVSKEPQGEARFKEIGEAYEVLQDPEKRAAYDQLGNRWREGQEFTPPPEWGAGFEFTQGGASTAEATDYSDFFSSLFGNVSRQANPPVLMAKTIMRRYSSRSRMRFTAEPTRLPCVRRR